MKRIQGLVAMVLILGGAALAHAEQSQYVGWLGLGWTTGGFSNFEGTQVSPLDTGKGNFFLGLGLQVLPPVPIYIGVEFNLMIARVGQESSTALVYNQQLLDTGSGYVFHAWISQASFKANYWDTDLSARLAASLKLAEGLVLGTAFVGVNWNYLTMDWEYDDPNNSVQTGEETLAGPVTQFLIGARVAVLFFYMDYTRYFSIVSNSKVDTTQIAGNRIGLGVHIPF